MKHKQLQEYYIGIMSGTSLDGVDTVLVSFTEHDFYLLGTHFFLFENSLKQELLALNNPVENELHRTQLASNQLAYIYAKAVMALLEKTKYFKQDIRAIACHGQTIRHNPQQGYSLQIGNPALLAELTKCTVVADFRNRDISAGGQGAPLVPIFHRKIFYHPQFNRVIINIGGISNITYLPKSGGEIIGFDCGAGNVLLDAWTEKHLQQPFDTDGKWASTGKVIPQLLNELLTHPFFEQKPPKSTGRELFNHDYFMQYMKSCYQANDVARTLVAFTVKSIVLAIQRYCSPVDEIYICGGGAHNLVLLSDLKEQFLDVTVHKTSQLGLHEDWVEAVTFAWIAHQTLAGKTSNLPEITGAKGERILGAIYPF